MPSRHQRSALLTLIARKINGHDCSTYEQRAVFDAHQRPVCAPCVFPLYCQDGGKLQNGFNEMGDRMVSWQNADPTAPCSTLDAQCVTRPHCQHEDDFQLAAHDLNAYLRRGLGAQQEARLSAYWEAYHRAGFKPGLYEAPTACP